MSRSLWCSKNLIASLDFRTVKMPICNFCHIHFIKGSALITHLKILHRCQEKGIFVCGEKNCHRHFPTLKSFRKHICKHEKKSDASTEKVKVNSKNQSHNINHSEKELLHISTHSQIPFTPIQDKLLTHLQEEEKENKFDLFKSTLLKKNISFLCNFYAEKTFCRKDVQTIMSSVCDLLSAPMVIFKEFLLEDICSFSSVTQESKSAIGNYFEEFEHLFRGLNSEYLRFKYLEKIECYIPPTQYMVGESFEKTPSSDVGSKKYTAEYISLGKVLKNFFSLPNVLSTTLEYMEKLNLQKNICNLIQTEFWKDKLSNYKETDTVLPLFFYYDEFESGNPLGSHAGIHKIGAVYFSVACLPPENQAHLENIFLALLFHASDIKEFGGNIVFSKLVEQINKLQEDGIEVKLSSGTKKIYFCAALFLGDNLGLNTILGFQQSFTANSFCRFCKCFRSETQNLCTERADSLRNKNNYDQDVAAQDSSSSGIKFSPVLNDIKYFHVTENYSIDVAHDIFEGIGVFIMAFLLHNFIFVEKLFDLDTLNHNIKFFDFAPGENKPPLISAEQLKKNILRMSASEMKCFILNSGLLFGYLIPVGNKQWTLYIILRKVLHIILSKSVPRNSTNLPIMIKELTSFYLEICKKPLKPKFHFLTHYSSIMNKIGPLLQTCTLRFEAKHRQLKLAANVVSSRINITRTLAIKHQLQLASRFVMNSGFSNDYTNCSILNNVDSIVQLIPNINELFNHVKIDEIKFERFWNNLRITPKLSVGSKTYKVNDVILIEYNEFPIFGKITHIIINQSNDLAFICEIIITICFNEHLFSYDVQYTKDQSVVFFFNMDTKETCKVINRNNKQYITIF